MKKNQQSHKQKHQQNPRKKREKLQAVKKQKVEMSEKDMSLRVMKTAKDIAFGKNLKQRVNKNGTKSSRVCSSI